MPQEMTPWTVLAATGALLAFLIGLYTLVGRERKSPYIINSVFQIFLICIIGAALDVASVISPCYKNGLLNAGAITLLLALLLTLVRVYKIYFRFAYFVDSGHPKHFVLWRFLKGLWRRNKADKSFEHHPLQMSEEDKTAVMNIVREVDDPATMQLRKDIELRSVAIAVEHQGQANEVLGRFALYFLKKGYPIQYMTASRHPIEFIWFLKSGVKKSSEHDWEDCLGRIVVIDAFTPHFGFTDSIYRDKTWGLKKEGVSYIETGVSFAGIHTASSKAFNILKEKTPDSKRPPILVLYEDSYALTDLESVEQYRLFIRHVLPSERLWDSMLTVFVETAQPDEDWKLLSSYTAIKLDLRGKAEQYGELEA